MDTMQEVQTDVPNKLAQLAKCAHESCTCTVESGEQYCSDYCASMANGDQAAGEHDCNCGHPECMDSAGHVGHVGQPTIGREGS